MFKDRIGKFSIDRETIEDTPAIVQEILSTVIVVRAEYMWDTNAVEYTGLSHSFEANPPGTRPSRYMPQVKDGHFEKWVKE